MLALDDSWAPRREACNTCLRTEMPLNCASWTMLNLLALVLIGGVFVIESWGCHPLSVAWAHCLLVFHSAVQAAVFGAAWASGTSASQARGQPRAHIIAEHPIGRRALARENPLLLFNPPSSSELPRGLRNIWSQLAKKNKQQFSCTSVTGYLADVGVEGRQKRAFVCLNKQTKKSISQGLLAKYISYCKHYLNRSQDSQVILSLSTELSLCWQKTGLLATSHKWVFQKRWPTFVPKKKNPKFLHRFYLSWGRTTWSCVTRTLKLETPSFNKC